MGLQVGWVAAQPVAGNAGGRASTAAEAPPRWVALTSAQQQALAPLKSEWRSIDASRKEKWLDVARRMPAMSATERARIQQRMSDWARMSPAERGRARIQFQEARKVAPGNREQRWQAYQALPPDERRELAEKASLDARKSPPAAGSPQSLAPQPSQRRGAAALAPASDGKRNILPFLPASPAQNAPKQVSPAVVQGKPGATTSLVTTPAKPPAHQQPGLPKVNAGAEFVNPSTLLPRRGPQGAAVIASEPAKSPKPATKNR